jgi:hypothetical protein
MFIAQIHPLPIMLVYITYSMLPLSAILGVISLIGLFFYNGHRNSKVIAFIAIGITIFSLCMLMIGVKKQKEFYRTHPPANQIRHNNNHTE